MTVSDTLTAVWSIVQFAIEVPARMQGETAEAFTPPESGPCIDLYLLPGRSTVKEIGDGPHARRTGLVIANVFIRPAEGISAAYAVIDTLTQTLEFAETDGVSLQQATYSDLGHDGTGFYQLQISVPFRSN